MKSPSASQIAAARLAAILRPTDAGRLVHVNYATWRQWEAGERRMLPAVWELFCIKTNQKTGWDIVDSKITI